MTELKEIKLPQVKRLNLNKKTLESLRELAREKELAEDKNTKLKEIKLPKVKPVKAFKSGNIALKGKKTKDEINITNKGRSR